MRICNHIDNDKSNNKIILMREVKVNSIQYQSVDNNESNWKIKDTLLLTWNEGINETKTYNESITLEKEKCINDYFTDAENNANIETTDEFKTIYCHTNGNNTEVHSP